MTRHMWKVVDDCAPTNICDLWQLYDDEENLNEREATPNKKCKTRFCRRKSKRAKIVNILLNERSANIGIGLPTVNSREAMAMPPYHHVHSGVSRMGHRRNRHLTGETRLDRRPVRVIEGAHSALGSVWGTDLLLSACSRWLLYSL